LADGIALADKLQQKKQVTAVFRVEGAASEGDFHDSAGTLLP